MFPVGWYWPIPLSGRYLSKRTCKTCFCFRSFLPFTSTGGSNHDTSPAPKRLHHVSSRACHPANGHALHVPLLLRKNRCMSRPLASSICIGTFCAFLSQETLHFLRLPLEAAMWCSNFLLGSRFKSCVQKIKLRKSRLASLFSHASSGKSSFSVKRETHKPDSRVPCMVALKTLHSNTLHKEM